MTTDPAVAAYNEVDQSRRLRRMKLVATGLLVLMAIVFVVAHLYILRWPVLGYVRAFAEASMVGALADWFAVTALFKHPLGIPIPHTAIIPRQKDRLGESLANFVRQNFLIPTALQPRLENTDFSRSISTWLSQTQNADKVASDIAGILRWLLGTVDSETLRDLVRRNLQHTLRDVTVTPLVGRVLDLLVNADHHQQLMDAAVSAARQHLTENRFAIRLKISTESPWWVPDFVDEEIYDKIVNEIEGMLDRIGTDESHAARIQFNLAAREVIESLKSDPDMISRGESLKDELLDHPVVQQYLADVWTHIAAYLREQSAQTDSELTQRISHALARVGETFRDDAKLNNELNRWVRDAIGYLVAQYRAGIASVISETVQAWDPSATSKRVELYVGRDLQFIRINGTLVGGFAGLAIYSLVKLL
ncbi:MAG: DUF445 domain-containing protein [Gammaproteobacteria bacterium]|nr:DUF445 domain-containing protein [Gammaproteobacteria bacterium]MDH3767870.1 DUF445 domain-containing protein [Gammaproteobacteria bacterium]